MRIKILPFILASVFLSHLIDIPFSPVLKPASSDICGCHSGSKLGETKDTPILKAALCGTAEEQSASVAASKDLGMNVPSRLEFPLRPGAFIRIPGSRFQFLSGQNLKRPPRTTLL